MAAVFAAAGACILAAGLAYHHHYQKAIERDAADLLSAIRHFKTEQIMFWRADRVNDTNSLLDSPVLSVFLNRLAAAPADPELRRQMRARLENYLKHNRYRAALFAWADGTLLLSAGETNAALQPEIKDLLDKAAASGKPELGDFYLGQNGKPHLALASVAATAPGGRKLMLVLEIAPEDYLYPLILSWPTNSSSGETTLSRREGDYALYLNELRHSAGAPLKLTAPLSDPQLADAKSLDGFIGTALSTDYRGKKVLASLGMIHGTGWGIVVKMDWEEIAAQAGNVSALILFFTLFMLLSAAALAYMIFLLQESGYSRDLKTAQAEKEKYRLNFETLSEKANDMLLLADLEDRSLLMVNQKACEAYGYTREEMLRLKPENLIPPENLPRFNARFASLGSGAGLVYETVHLKKSGERFPLEVSATGILQGGRNLVYFICRDITARKRLEGELKEKERTLAAMMYNLPGMAYRCKNDPRWTMEFVSQGCESLTGYKPAELLGNNALSFNDLMVPEDRDRVWREVQTALSANKPFQFIYRIRRKDNGTRTVWEQGNAVKAPDGTIEALEGLIIDSSEKAAAEEALRDSQQRYQNIFETMNEAFASHTIISDGQGRPVDYRFLEVNPAFEKITGLRKQDIVGRTVLEVMPDTEKVWIETYGKVALTGERIHFENYASALGKWYEVSAFRPRKGEFAVTFFDITARKNSELETERLNRELQKNLRLYTILAQLNQAAAQLKDHKKLFERICGIAVTAGGFKLAWIGYPDRDAGRVLPLNFRAETNGAREEINSFLYKSAGAGGPTAEAAASGRISSCRDTQSVTGGEPWHLKTAQLGYRSAAAVPLYDGNKLAALLTLYSADADAFPEEELKMLSAIQAEINLALEAIYAEEQRAETQAALERTADHLANAMAAAPLILFTLRLVGNKVLMQWVTGNPRAITGHDPDELFVPGWLEDSLHPDDKSRVLRETGEVTAKGSMTHDFRLKKKGGAGYVWVRGNIKAGKENPGEITGTWTDITELKEAELRCRNTLETRDAGAGGAQ